MRPTLLGLVSILGSILLLSVGMELSSWTHLGTSALLLLVAIARS